MQRITWWPGDYLRDTGDLSLMEHGAYRVLLDHYYATDGRLKADQIPLYRICRAMTGDEQAAVGKIVKMFFTVDEDGWLHNKKADGMIAEHLEYVRNASEAGKKGAANRWGNGKPVGNHIGNPKEENMGNPMRTPMASTTNKDLKEGASGSAIFTEGLQHLVNCGTAEKEARTFLGMLLRDWEEAEVAAAVRASFGAQAPLPYIRKVLASRPKKAKAPAGTDAILAKLREKYPSIRVAQGGAAFFDPVTQNRFSLTGERLVSA